MADISDVQNTLVGLIAGALYPNGTGQDSAVGAQCRVGSGWPTKAQLDPDLAHGIVNVSVYPTSIEHKTSRYMPHWQEINRFPPTVTLTSDIGGSITVGGTIAAPFHAQNTAVLIGGHAFTYAVQASDTLATVASALAALIAAQYPGTSSTGAVITLPAGTPQPTLRTGGYATVAKEVKRQSRVVRIVIWSPTPTLRDKVASLLDAFLAQIEFLTLPDGFGGRLLYHHSDLVDLQEKANLYRRDLCYSVEFPTTVTQQATDVTVTVTNLVEPTSGATIKQIIY
jgi:hypothetical protein